MSEEINTIFKLADQVNKLNAGAGHMQLNNINHTKGVTAVISVYNNQKPYNVAMDELYEWAEENAYHELINKLNSLINDMSWNKHNQV